VFYSPPVAQNSEEMNEGDADGEAEYFMGI